MMDVRYMSPEAAQRSMGSLAGEPTIEDDIASDVYSLGVVLWEIYHGSRPYGDVSDDSALRTIASGKMLKYMDDSPDASLNTIQRAGERACAPSPEGRPTAAVISGMLSNMC